MKTKEQMQADIDRLRAALRGLMFATANVRTHKAIEAFRTASAVWVDTVSDEQKARAVKIAQQYNPSISTYAEALHEYGTQILTSTERR